MERRAFMQSSGLLAAFAALPGFAGALANPPAHPGLKPFMMPPAEPLPHKGGMDIRVWVRSHQTGGVYSCIECAVAPKLMGPPPHHHPMLDELMYVVEGTAGIMVGDEVVEVPAGGWHFRPHGLPHTFWNATDKPLRFLDMYFNQPFEDFLEKIFHELTPENGFQPGSEKLQQAQNKLNEKYGVIYAPTAIAERQAIIEKYGLR